MIRAIAFVCETVLAILTWVAILAFFALVGFLMLPFLVLLGLAYLYVVAHMLITKTAPEDVSFERLGIKFSWKKDK